MTLFSTRTSDRAQIWHACADRDETGSHQNKLTHPTPGGFRGYLLMFVGYVMMFVCLWVGDSYASLTYFGDLFLWTAPKFGTHVRIDTLTLKKIDPPHPNLSRRTAPKFGTHVRIDTLTLKRKFDPPHPRGFRGLSIVKNLSRCTAPKFGTHVQIDTVRLTLKKFDPPHPRGV